MLTLRPPDEVLRVLAGLGLAFADGLWTDAPHTIGVARSTAGLFVGWLDVGWVGAGDPFSEMRDVAHLPERVPPPRLAAELRIAIDEAGRARSEHLRDCDRCEERFVPGQMYGAACCYSCAVQAGDV